MKLRVLSYNIHKGFNAYGSEFVLEKIKSSIREVQADLVLLQEVVGESDSDRKKILNWPTPSQFEFLADQTWAHHAYGKNAVYSSGHHGNAILSKYPILFSENVDISHSKYERRGLLHAEIKIPEKNFSFHAICTHLGLFEKDRQKQIQTLVERVREKVPDTSPLIVAGDFNDWRKKISISLRKKLRLDEAFHTTHTAHAKTFPSWFPLLSLDRIYFRGLYCSSVKVLNGKSWCTLSDHLPLLADFTELKI